MCCGVKKLLAENAAQRLRPILDFFYVECVGDGFAKDFVASAKRFD